jgi:hypothetical protein
MSPKSGSIELALRIVLERPTAGVDFGLQAGHGSVWEIAQKQRSKGEDLIFDFMVTAKPSRKDSLPNFTGHFVQGPSGQRFVYINIGTYAGQTNTSWSRRLKIPLYIISWDEINSGKTLVAHIPGTGKDGGPSCAHEWRKRVGQDWGWQLEAAPKHTRK